MELSKLYKLPGWKIFLHLLRHDRYFQAGLLIKLVFAALFASDFLTELFAPFIKSALNDGFFDVYKNTYPVKPNAFPYPPVMLYILALPRYLASFIWTTAGPVNMADLFFLRLPLVIADVAILVVLIKWLKNFGNSVKLYWLNPIVIYVCYIHGQLDIIPTAFLCLSLYYLFSKRMGYFIVFLALACASKFHIILAIPLLGIYLFRSGRAVTLSNVTLSPSKGSKGSGGLGLLITALLFTLLLLLLNLPFLLQPEFISMVYQNAEQGKIFTSYFNIFDDYHFIFIPAIYLMSLYLMLDFKFINRDILLIFLALSFGIITFFIVPSQGWYLWNMPFFIYFVIRFDFKTRYLFFILNLAYFLFFIFYPKSDFPQVAQFILRGAGQQPNLYLFLEQQGINPESLLSLIFTFLQTSLLLFCVAIFRLGVMPIRRHKIYHQPYLIGICGDSGTGKSVLSEGITALFGLRNTLVVHGDDMHRWERGHEKWNELTHLSPKANWLHRDLADIINLKAGKSISRRFYDHDTGKFSDLHTIHAERIIVYEGLHAFYLKQATAIYDLKIFMKPSEELRRYWKIQRDVQKRGVTAGKVLEAIEKRMDDANLHIYNQEFEADIVFSIVEILESGGEPKKNIADKFALVVTSSNAIYFEGLLDCLKNQALLSIAHDIEQSRQEMRIEGEISPEKIEEIAELLQLNTEELLGNIPSWESNYLGIMQLFVLYYVLTQLKGSGMMVEAEANGKDD